MPRIKKSIVTDKVEVEPLISPEKEPSAGTPVSIADNKDTVKKEKISKTTIKNIAPEIQEPIAKMAKEQFKQLYIKDTCWLENDIYQTIDDMTEGKKTAKAVIINQALKDYFKKNKLGIIPLRTKEKKE